MAVHFADVAFGRKSNSVSVRFAARVTCRLHGHAPVRNGRARRALGAEPTGPARDQREGHPTWRLPGIGQPLLRCLNSGIHAVAMPGKSVRRGGAFRQHIHVLAKRNRHRADSPCGACRPHLTAAQGPRVEQRTILARTRCATAQRWRRPKSQKRKSPHRAGFSEWAYVSVRPRGGARKYILTRVLATSDACRKADGHGHRLNPPFPKLPLENPAAGIFHLQRESLKIL